MNPLNQTNLQSEGAHNRMTHTSDQAIVSPLSDKNISNPNCEAYRCNNEATNQVTVSVGKLGEINLNLCKICVPQFSDSNDPASDSMNILHKKVKSDANQTAPTEEGLIEPCLERITR